MARQIDLTLWFLVGFLFVGGVEFAFAEGTVPASTGGVESQAATYGPLYAPAEFNVFGQVGTTGAAACSAAGYSGSRDEGVNMTVCTNASGGDAANAWRNVCPVGYSADGAFTYASGDTTANRCKSTQNYYQCPDSSWTLSGQTCTRNTGAGCPANSTGPVGTAPNQFCTCAAGFDAVSGQCQARSCPASGSSPGTYVDNLSGGEAGCVNGCKVDRTSYPGPGTSCWPVNPTGYASNTDLRYYCNMAYSGATCSMPSGQSWSSGPYTNCPAGYGEATINGVTSCSKTPAVSSSNTTTSTTSTNGGAGTTTTTTTDTKMGSDGTATTTTTTTGPNGTTTTTEQQTKGTFCQENPSSPMCKEVQDPCSEHPERLSCSEFGSSEDPGAFQTKTLGTSSITPVSVAENATCPADIALPKGTTFSWGPSCQFAEGVKPVVLTIAWILALGIVFGAVRGET